MTRRKLLRGVPRLRWGEGRDVTLSGALAASLQAAGDARDDLYDLLMAASGAAFEFHLDPERWDPAVTSPHSASAVDRAAAAGGTRADRLDPPFDDEMRELIWERIVEAVDASLPPLVRGLGGAREFGVLVGYDDAGHVLFARTYVDRGDEPTRASFDVFAGADAPSLVFLDRAATPPERGLDAERVAHAAAVARQTAHEEEDERALAGQAAYAAWAAGLAAETRGPDAANRAFADWWIRVTLSDARRAAARWLRRVRTRFPERRGADLVLAAEAYGYVADELAKGVAPSFDATGVTRFLDPATRRGLAHAVERAAAREREAADALARE